MLHWPDVQGRAPNGRTALRAGFSIPTGSECIEKEDTMCVRLVCVVVCMCNGNCATHGASRGIQHSQHDIRACEQLRIVGMLSIG